MDIRTKNQRILLIHRDSLMNTPFLRELSKHCLIEVAQITTTSMASEMLATRKFDAIFVHATAIDALNDIHLISELANCPVYTISATSFLEGRRDLLQSLSVRELQVFEMMAKGLTSGDIGRRLNLSPKTVDTYRSRVRHKLQIDSHAQLIVAALRMGVIPISDWDTVK